jgi:hypothetical protein
VKTENWITGSGRRLLVVSVGINAILTQNPSDHTLVPLKILAALLKSVPQACLETRSQESQKFAWVVSSYREE